MPSTTAPMAGVRRVTDNVMSALIASKKRMHGAEYGNEQIAPRELAVALVDEMRVALQQFGAVVAIVSRYVIPRHGRLQVMGHVQIVIQVQHAENRIGLDRGGSFL